MTFKDFRNTRNKLLTAILLLCLPLLAMSAGGNPSQERPSTKSFSDSIAEKQDTPIGYEIFAMSSISRRNDGSLRYTLGYNHSLGVTITHKKHKFLMGASMVYIPDLPINQVTGEANPSKMNWGVLLGYKYSFSEPQKSTRWMFQYLFRLTAITYPEAQVGFGQYLTDHGSSENTFGIGLEQDVSRNLFFYFGANIGFRDGLEGNGNFIGTLDLGLSYSL